MYAKLLWSGIHVARFIGVVRKRSGQPAYLKLLSDVLATLLSVYHMSRRFK